MNDEFEDEMEPDIDSSINDLVSRVFSQSRYDFFEDTQEPEIDTTVNDFITNALENAFNEEVYIYNSRFRQNISPINTDIYRNSYLYLENIFDSMLEFQRYNLPPFSPILTELFSDPIDEVMRESMDMQSDILVKSDNIIEISSFEYGKMDENFKLKNTKCTICITDFEENSLVSETKCKHVFHNECIVEWGKYKTDCPICREKI